MRSIPTGGWWSPSRTTPRIKPAPDVKYPAFAIVAELNSADSDFAERAQGRLPDVRRDLQRRGSQEEGRALELGSEEVEGVKLATASYMVPRNADPGSRDPRPAVQLQPVDGPGRQVLHPEHQRGPGPHADQGAENRTTGGRPSEPETAVLEADGPELARLLEQNRGRLAMQFMLNRGETKEKAEGQVDLGLALLRYLGHGRA